MPDDGEKSHNSGSGRTETGRVGFSLRDPSGDVPMQIARAERVVLDQLDVAVVVTDLQGVIMHWNRAAESLFGWTVEESVGRNVVDVLVPTGGRQAAFGIMSNLETGEPWQ